jgi:ribonucleases P/MRP protein subunit RPP40
LWLRKAFDCVNHVILLEEVESTGIVDECKSLLGSFMQLRTQFVKVGFTKSENKIVKCGIVQGSVLGSLLFLIFVNSIFKLELRGKIQLFADDAVILYSAKTYEELKNNMEYDLKLLNDWLIKYRLTMNVDKTHFIIFETKNSNTNGIFDELNFQDKKITRVSNYKYLGLWLDDRLDFSVHIAKIKSKLSPMVGVFRRINKCITIETLKNLYFAYVHSHIVHLI